MRRSRAITNGWPIAPGVPIVTGDKILTFSNLVPLQFSDGQYLELAA